MKRSPIRHRSKKTEKRMREVKPMYAARFAEHPICEVPECWKPSTEPHHHTVKRRLGEGLFQFRVVCGSCHHEVIHKKVGEAKAKGLLDCLTDSDWGVPHGGRNKNGTMKHIVAISRDEEEPTPTLPDVGKHDSEMHKPKEG